MNDLTMIETASGYRAAIQGICNLGWAELDRRGLTAAAWAYYYFSIQFRENLQIAIQLYPHDPALQRLRDEECATDNLSPWAGVASVGEKLDHDEFMRRVLQLTPVDPETRTLIEQTGQAYLSRVRAIDDHTRAMSITSYEDGGLESVFKAILQCQCWDTALLEGFRHFLVKHISFDCNPEAGHGALIRHLAPDERVQILWSEFHDLLVTAVPSLRKIPLALTSALE